jgi:hypothetical protein
MIRKEIRAITEEDFIEILKKEQLLEKFEKNELLCYKCGNIVNNLNLLGYIYKDNVLVILCNDEKCLGK